MAEIETIATTYNVMILVKIIAAVLVGFTIGYFRRNNPAGIRTFTLICLGSALFTMTSVDHIFGSSQGYDPSRIIANIVTGIGFLGAGVIWKYEDKLMGLTTAATIWATAAVGINIGLGEWFTVIASAAAVILVLMSKKITTKIPGKKSKKKKQKQTKLS